MSNEKYNGWTNRETWLVNLYYEEYLREEKREFITTENVEEILTMNSRDYIYQLANHLKSRFEDLMEEEMEKIENNFIIDFIDFSRIDWDDLAESYYEE